ncbi:energy transducer TonB [Pedobacter ureilyticus]|uniref:TonB family protein n=1 Tax=Pedobacter ureilyticus TaxID=1393051 RepID=A0ABW9J6C4_9SPHI|nr:energy transducer TonB [Pedobacter helvus]
MKKLTLILLLAITKIGFAQNSQQDTTLIYSSPMYTKDPVRSKWRPVIKRAGEFYQVSFFDRKDVLQEIISFEDRELTVRKGAYSSYQKGKLKEKGAYDKGHKNGEWITYQTDGETQRKVENFTHGKLDGRYTEYWNGNKEEGSYVSGKKTGIWKFTYKEGKPAGEEVYDEAGKKVDGKYYSKEGNVVKYEDLFAPPSYEGGLKEFYKYLSTEIKYPTQSLKQKIEGTVKLSFIVRKNGDVESVEILEAPNNELAIEAIRVLQMAPDWVPGKQFGEVTSVKYNIPIKFSLRR